MKANKNAMRPEKLKNFFGQNEIKKNLSIYINSAKQQEIPLDHVLLFGPPGLGKTTLAMIIGNELGVKTHVISAPSIEKISDLVTVLATIDDGDVVFIDEIHRLPIAVEEVLYSAMEDFKIDIIIENGGDKKTITLNLEPFTLVGATTRSGLISKPMRDRFGIVLQMKDYSIDELSKIVKNATKYKVNDEAAEMIANASRNVPRLSLNILKRSIDHLIDLNEEIIDKDIVKKCINGMNITEEGLNDLDISYLKLLNKNPNKAIGISTIASILDHDKKTIEDDVEPYLLKKSFIEKTPKGRKITTEGISVITERG